MTRVSSDRLLFDFAKGLSVVGLARKYGLTTKRVEHRMRMRKQRLLRQLRADMPRRARLGL
jgi:Mor family transcriptional regulator